MLGADGFKSLISGAAKLPLGARLQAVVEKIARDDSSLHDDLTILAIESANARPE